MKPRLRLVTLNLKQAAQIRLVSYRHRMRCRPPEGKLPDNPKLQTQAIQRVFSEQHGALQEIMDRETHKLHLTSCGCFLKTVALVQARIR